MATIIPAILATTEQRYKEDIEKVNSVAHLLDGWVHIDFMDNIFVPNKSIDPSIAAKYPTTLKKEAHLMVQNPALMIQELISLGFERIVVHVESESVASSLALIEEARLNDTEIVLETGLAINYETPLTEVKPFLNDLDLLLFMAIKPGFQGQEFMPEVLNKIKEARKFGLTIEIDGGISLGNVRMVIEAGVDNLIIGSHLLNGNITQNLEKFKQILNQS